MSNYRFITATDTNPVYCGFIIPWIEHHKKLYPESHIQIILVSNDLPKNLEKYKENIILYEPATIGGTPSGGTDLPTSYLAQMIRLFYPILLDDKYNIISDIDLFILTKDLLTLFNRIENTNKYINYGCLTMNDCHREKQLPLAFSVMSNKVIKDIFKIETLKDINDLLTKSYKADESERGYCWFTDQLLLYEKFIDYEHFYKLERSGGDRVDRDWFSPFDAKIQLLIKNNCIVDFHAPRPYQKYKKFIDTTLNLAPIAAPFH